MASSDMREELSCSICLSVYTDPVALTCGHNYCRFCIGKVLDSQRQHGHYSCPECREVFPKRPQLKKNMKLHNILEHFRHVRAQPEDTGVFCTYCIQSSVPAVKTCVLCEASLCDNHLRVHSKSVEHVLTEPTSTIGNRKCPAHKKVLEYYCFQDKACVCVYCTLGNEHRGHRMVPLNEASGVKKETLDNILKTLTAKNERVCDQIRQLESARTELARKMRHVDSLCKTGDPLAVLEERESDREDFCHVREIDDIKINRQDERQLTPIQFCIFMLIIVVAMMFSDKEKKT